MARKLDATPDPISALTLLGFAKWCEKQGTGTYTISDQTACPMAEYAKATLKVPFAWAGYGWINIGVNTYQFDHAPFPAVADSPRTFPLLAKRLRAKAEYFKAQAKIKPEPYVPSGSLGSFARGAS